MRALAPVLLSALAAGCSGGGSTTLTDVDGRRREVARTVVRTTCGSGCRGTFRGVLRFDTPRTARGRILAEEGDGNGDGYPDNSAIARVGFRSPGR